MAKLTGGAGIGGNRRAAFKHGLVVTSWRGIPVIRLKKTGRRKAISPKQAAAMDTFSELANAAKRITTGEYETAVEMSKHSQYLWRDLYFMALSGRLWTWTEPQQGKWISMASRTTMSDALDALGSQYASVLIRGEEFWEILVPGEPGQVLTTMGPSAAPVWGPSGGGGAPANIVLQTTTGGPINSTWPKPINWDSALNLDWPGWDVSAPSIITTPNAPGKIRGTFSLVFSNTTSATTFVANMRDPLDLTSTLRSTRTQYAKNASSWQDAQMTASGVWQDNIPGEQMFLRVNLTPAVSVGYAAGCFFQLEFVPD